MCTHADFRLSLVSLFHNYYLSQVCNGVVFRSAVKIIGDAAFPPKGEMLKYQSFGAKPFFLKYHSDEDSNRNIETSLGCSKVRSQLSS